MTLIITAFAVLVTVSCVAALPSLGDAMRDGAKDTDKRMESETAWALEKAGEVFSAYDDRHPLDLHLDFLSVNQLKRIARERANDLAPRLMLLPREVKNDEDAQDWFASLKEAYSLSANHEQRVITLSLAMTAVFTLEHQSFGRTMLKDLKLWLDALPPAQAASLSIKVQLLRLFIAMGLENYDDVSLYAKGTPFRALAPLWMMSKGKWDHALEEAHRAKAQPDLDANEKTLVDMYESVLAGTIQHGKAKARDAKTAAPSNL